MNDIYNIREELGKIMDKCLPVKARRSAFGFSRKQLKVGEWDQIFNKNTWLADSWLVNWGCILGYNLILELNCGEKSLIPEGFLVFGKGPNGDLLAVSIETEEIGWFPIDLRREFCPTIFSLKAYLTAAYDNDFRTPRDYWSAIEARDERS